MSFWNLSDGTSATATGNTFESGGGDIEPIPNNTGCIAAIEEAGWDHYDGDDFISLKWRVARPEEHANRVIFQKVKVMGMAKDKDRQATAEKAKRMLAAIDANAGGRLSQMTDSPSDSDLMSALMGKMMAIKVMVWSMDINGEKKTGNWISAVAPAKKGAAPNPVPAPQQPAVDHSQFDDDIPF